MSVELWVACDGVHCSPYPHILGRTMLLVNENAVDHGCAHVCDVCKAKVDVMPWDDFGAVFGQELGASK